MLAETCVKWLKTGTVSADANGQSVRQGQVQDQQGHFSSLQGLDISEGRTARTENAVWLQQASSTDQGFGSHCLRQPAHLYLSRSCDKVSKLSRTAKRSDGKMFTWRVPTITRAYISQQRGQVAGSRDKSRFRAVPQANACLLPSPGQVPC